MGGGKRHTIEIESGEDIRETFLDISWLLEGTIRGQKVEKRTPLCRYTGSVSGKRGRLHTESEKVQVQKLKHISRIKCREEPGALAVNDCSRKTQKARKWVLTGNHGRCI